MRQLGPEEEQGIEVLSQIEQQQQRFKPVDHPELGFEEQYGWQATAKPPGSVHDAHEPIVPKQK